MGQKAEIWHTYRETTQTKGENLKLGQIFTRGVRNGRWKMQFFFKYRPTGTDEQDEKDSLKRSLVIVTRPV
jgi:hypothetical protein